MTRQRKILLFGIALLVAVIGAVPFYAAHQLLHPPWLASRAPALGLVSLEDQEFGQTVWQGKIHDPRTDFGIAFEEVSFPARDGSTLRGWFVPRDGADAALVTVHGGGADRREFLRHLPVLHGAGVAVLLFDCREHGISDARGLGISFGIREHQDVSSAVAYLKHARGFGRVAVLGTSQGGASVIMAAASDPSIDVIIAENPFTRVDELMPSLLTNVGGIPSFLAHAGAWLAQSRLGPDWRQGPIDVVDKLAPRPLLLMHGTADIWIAAENSERLFAHAAPPKELWIADGAKHAQLFNLYPEEWARRVGGFLAGHLGPTTATARRGVDQGVAAGSDGM